jgi:hypothetical protein
MTDANGYDDRPYDPRSALVAEQLGDLDQEATVKRNRSARSTTAQRIRSELASYRCTSGLSYGGSLARAANWLDVLIRAHNAGQDVDISERVVMTAEGYWTTVKSARKSGTEVSRWHWSVLGYEPAFDQSADL